jgi:hypothetical protein
MRVKAAVFQEIPSLDQRVTELQSQIDRLTVALQSWREQQDHLRPAEERLSQLTHQCAEVIRQWSGTNERQAIAVDELEERVSAFSATEERLHRDAAERIRALERVIEQEWSSLRQIHSAPVRELREHAAMLGQLSVAAANSSVTASDRTEARLAAIERTVQQQLSGVSRQLEQAVAEIRALVPGRAPDPPASAAWPIEGVVRLHNQLREADAGTVVVDRFPGSSPAAPRNLAVVPTVLPSVAPDIAPRLDSREQDVADTKAQSRTATAGHQTTSRMIWFSAATAVMAVVLAAASAVMIQRQVRAALDRAADAQQHAQQAVTAANAQVVASRDEAARQIAQARLGSTRAQTVGDVLASPDLVRFNIAGSGATPLAGQVLWSRTRGVVFSGVRIPAAPGGMVYQLWLLTDGLPANAGTFAPDETGRVTFTADAPRIPRPVVGAALTVEPAGGSQAPSDRLLGQNRIVRPAPVQPPPPDAPR